MNRDLNICSRGYTLIEVLVVVTIIGIAGSIVVPHMVRGGEMQIQAAGRMVISDLLMTQNEAIARQAVRRMTFDTTANQYAITDSADAVVAAPWKGGGDYIVNFSTDGRFNGVRITAVNFNDTTTVSFDDLGAPSSGGTIDLVSGDTTYRITVASFTGRVTIAEVGAEAEEE